MPGPNAIGGPSRTLPQPNADAPPATEAPSLESQQEAAITEAFSRSTTQRRRTSIPAYAGVVKSKFGIARGNSTMAAALLNDAQIGQMAGRSPDELARNFVRAGLEPSDAWAMAEAVGQRVGAEIRNEVRVRGHELIAERRTQLTAARDAIAALQNAPEGTPPALVYDAMVERFGEEKIGELMQAFEDNLEALDNWDRRIDGQVWTLGELGDAARDVVPQSWLGDGAVATEQIGRGENELDRFADEMMSGGEMAHLAYEVVAFAVEAGHAAAEAAGSAIGAVATTASLVVHHFAHEAHEDFVHGMQQLFEDAR